MENNTSINKGNTGTKEITLKDLVKFFNDNVRLGYNPENHSGSFAFNTKAREFTITWRDREKAIEISPDT